jgi:outer membrane protein
MTTSILARALAGAAALATVAGAGTSLAQTRAAAPAAASAGGITVAGPIIPGVCIFNNERAYQTSTVGKDVIAKMQGFTNTIRGELGPEQTALQNDAKTYQAQRASLSADVQRQRDASFEQRAAQFQQKAQIRNRELEMTQQKAMEAIGAAMQPVLVQVYGARGCGLLLDRGALIAANAQMDITDQVVQGLNGKMTTLPLTLEHLPTQPTAAPAPTRK